MSIRFKPNWKNNDFISLFNECEVAAFLFTAVCWAKTPSATAENDTPSIPHQCTYMGSRPGSQSVQAVSPFQDGNDFTVTALVSHVHQFPGNPIIIVIRKTQATQRIFLWASNPADKISKSGLNFRRAGKISYVIALRNSGIGAHAKGAR